MNKVLINELSKILDNLIFENKNTIDLCLFFAGNIIIFCTDIKILDDKVITFSYNGRKQFRDLKELTGFSINE